MNSVTELKISVFKKCDLNGLFGYANADMMDRFHVGIYIFATLLQTSQNRLTVFYQAAGLLGLKIIVDAIKLFYLTRMNKHDMDFFSGMRNDIYKKLYELQY